MSGGPWQCLEGHGNVWRAMATSGGPWQRLEGHGNVRRAMATSGGPWQRPEDHGNVWRAMAMSGNDGHQNDDDYILHCRTKELFEVSTNASYAPIHNDANQTSVSLVSVKAKINVNPLPNFTTQLMA